MVERTEMIGLGTAAFAASVEIRKKELESKMTKEEAEAQIQAEYFAGGGINWPGISTAINLLHPRHVDERIPAYRLKKTT